VGVFRTLSKEQAASLLGVSERRVLRLIKEEKITAYVVGHEGTWRIYYGSLMRYREKQLQEEANKK